MTAKKILILNILAEDHFRTSFDARMIEAFDPIGTPYDVIHIADLATFDAFADYTHLAISGSTESAGEDCAFTPYLEAIITRFQSDKKSILGICYGHQFLARMFMGKPSVQKSTTPEMGWTDIALNDNPIFKNIQNFKSAVFHYDQVVELDDRFEITASSERCAIHGFQLKDHPIWGVQFHPDFLYRDVPAFIDEVRTNPDFAEIHCQTPTTEQEYRANDLIFKNWIEIS